MVKKGGKPYMEVYLVKDPNQATFADGGMMADGGELEVGDKVKAKYAKYHGTVTDIVDDYAIIEYPDGKVKKSYLKDLQKVSLGVATEYVNPKYMADGGMMAKGGITKSKEEYPELRKIADKIADDTSERINKEVKDVKSKMPYKAQWVLEEVVRDLENRI
jgi:hypothetical protein